MTYYTEYNPHSLPFVKIFDQGYNAHRAGKPLKANPYPATIRRGHPNGPDTNPEHRTWANGWEVAREYGIEESAMIGPG